MSDVSYIKAFNCLIMEPKLTAEAKKLAKKREHQRRHRKEKLYSYPPTVKSCNTSS